ncbi:DUF1254 domain-containing protein [Bordetella sp. 15P40C-2]|uniref:DUF1254 domain-containing protein n=1 Tax=Bordetella sp. 15P40C-2 TaxID=2572246 RepID=UPI001329FCD2|nr:DUF1254 domain-containing protein [Bordetella sp. 15P40C-2]MVW71487.1 DUF1254 domain-containing protein [Bordetella sp. 15P40C-2]
MPYCIAHRREWPKAILAGAISAGFACAAWAQAPQPSMRLVSQTPTAAVSPSVTADELQDIAVDAYLYAYPMVLMEATRRASTQVQTSLAGRAPMNQFGHRTAFPEPGATDVGWPSADMLYSSLWYDVSRQPLLIRVPASGGRYYSISLLDMWSDEFASRGSRVTGDGEQQFLLVGPHWHGPAPSGTPVVRSPTGMGWLLARIQTGGPNEYGAVNQFQAAMSATPYAVSPPTPAPLPMSPQRAGAAKPPTWQNDGAYGGASAWRPPAAGFAQPSAVTWDLAGTPAEQVANMSAATFFTLFNELLRTNPPHANDNTILTRMHRIGLIGPQPFSYDRLDPAVKQALEEARPLAGRRIADTVTHLGTPANGWNTVRTGIGSYGTDYARRAAVAYAGLGATTPDEALYPVTAVDDRGRPLVSNEDYVLHFDKAQLPPVNGSWSLTVYNQNNAWSPNNSGRYTLRSTDPLKYNADGSLDIYLSRNDPGTQKRANWLQTPQEGPFTLNMRLYSPKDLALDGGWAPPPVRRD